MKEKLVKAFVVTGVSAFLLFQFNVPPAESSWGAAKLLNNYQAPSYSVPSSGESNTQTPPPSNPVPDTANTNQQDSQKNFQSIAEKIKYLRAQKAALGSDNNQTTPAQPNDPVQTPTEPQQPQENNEQETTVNVSQEVMYLFNKINEERTSRGIEPLTLDPELIKFAQKRSDYISEDPFNRMNHNGMAPGGENVSYTSDIYKAHRLLMASEPHRENILRSVFNRVGIGISYDQNGYVIVVQTFQY